MKTPNVAELVSQHIIMCRRPPSVLFVGLTGPQGSGKSTVARGVAEMLRPHCHVAVPSLDDFYLTREQRRGLAESVHPLLAVRGPPGTHDLDLAKSVIGRLLAGECVSLPRFDKAADDRSPIDDWQVFEGPADVVLFEGWCLGARPQPRSSLLAPINALERERDPDGIWRRVVNTALEDYQTLFDRFDVLIALQPPAFEIVPVWREQQEAVLRQCSSSDSQCMSAPEVQRFVQHFERVSRELIPELERRADVVITLDQKRSVTSVRTDVRSG